MSSTSKRKVKQIEPRKQLPVSRLMKCYICSQHFDSNTLFEQHMKQHQNVLNRTTSNQMRISNTEIFQAKKTTQLPARNSMLTAIDFHQTGGSCNEKTDGDRYKAKEEDDKEVDMSEALKQSTILLQKVTFMTDLLPDKQSENIQIEPTPIQQTIPKIQTQKQLYKQLTPNTASTMSNQILQTYFTHSYLQNYQDQLIYLNNIEPYKHGEDIASIRLKICMEVYRQLADIYGETGEFELKERHVDNNTMEIVDNTSAVCCSECYSEIECKQYYRFACGHAYHMECWQQQSKCCK